MPEPLLRQFSSFLLLFLGGLALGFALDILSAFRLVLRPRGAHSFLLDLLYWLAALVLIFPLLATSTWGDLRLFVWLALLAGSGYYFCFLRGLGRQLSLRLARAVLALFRLPGRAWHGARFVRAKLTREERKNTKRKKR